MFLCSFAFLMLLGLSSAQTDPSATVPGEVETDPTMSTDEPVTSASVSTATEPTSETPPETTTSPPDSLSVVCTNEKMVVFLDFSNHGNLDLDKVTLKDANCKAPGPVNATHLSMDVPFDSCMTNHSTDGDTITYQNSLIAETRASAGSSLISREFQAEFPFKCTYPRSAVLSVVAFSPRERIVYTKTAEFGNFTFTMDMYKTDKYETPYEVFPVRLDLDDPMFLEVKVSSNDSKLVLIPLKCWATPSSDLNDAKYYTFIENGCKEEKDPSIVFNYKESNVQRFQMGAFRFLGESLNSNVYLHCDVEACRKGDNDSRCAKGCESIRRRRRSSLASNAGTEQTVTLGPMKIGEKAEVGAQEAVSSLTIFAAVAGVLGVIVLFLAVALVMLYKRYRSPQSASRVVYTKTANEEGKLLV